MKIFIDIETIPVGPEPIFVPEPFAGVRVPSNYRNKETIDKYIAENTGPAVLAWEQEQEKRKETELIEWKKGALKATRSQIVCICAITSQGTEFKQSLNDEASLMWNFMRWLELSVGISVCKNTDFVGHNIESFDIPMLRTHAIKHYCHSIHAALTFEKFSTRIHDTMLIWDKKNWTKLPEIAEFLGIENRNGDTTGADIYELYKAGKFDEIETKCMNDTLMCKEVYERIY